MDRRTLERRLDALAGFDDPDVEREQYPTDPAVAAHLLHAAAMAGDLSGRTVIDLGAGTGVLALGATILGSERVVAIEVDPAAVAVGRENVRRLDTQTAVEWIVGDVRRLPLAVGDTRDATASVAAASADVTVLANPPFGAQDGTAGADRPFLDAAAALADVSYTIHNAGSREFVEAYAEERGGSVAAAFAVRLDVDRQFGFHEAERATIPAEAYRISWP